jgi:hypothetical protein
VAGVAASLADDVVTAATRSAASTTVDPMRAIGARANSEAGRVVDDKAGMQRAIAAVESAAPVQWPEN